MKSAQRRRETYVGPWLPDPIVDDEEEEDDITLPLMLALERAAFLLHDVFGESFEAVAATIGRDAAACCHLAARARTHVRDARPRFKLEKERGFQLAEAFFTASRSGDMAALGALLAADVAFHADGGGKRRAVQRPVLGVEAVLRLHEALGTLFARQNSHLVRVGLVMASRASSHAKATGNCRQPPLRLRRVRSERSMSCAIRTSCSTSIEVGSR